MIVLGSDLLSVVLLGISVSPYIVFKFVCVHKNPRLSNLRNGELGMNPPAIDLPKKYAWFEFQIKVS
jgi:hypothetical protein